MKKTFAITCHKLNNPLIYTVNYLSSFPENTIIIHLDKKCSIDNFKILKAENVFFIHERESIVWGGVSQIYATINLLRESLRFNTQYFFLLSGDDIPVMSNRAMNKFLTEHSGFEFIHFQEHRNNHVDPVRRVKFRFLNVHYSRKTNLYAKVLRKMHYLLGFLFLNKVYLRESLNFPVLYKGINWFGITNDSVLFILNYIERNPWYLNAFENSLCCDEVFFHSILNTKKNAIFYIDPCGLNNALRYIDWTSGPQFPKILEECDIQKINNKNIFFARKIPDEMPVELMQKFMGKDE